MISWTQIAVVILSTLVVNPVIASTKKLLSEAEVEANRNQQSIYVRITSSRQNYLERELIFVTYWLENVGTSPAYFHWQDLKDLELIKEDRSKAPLCRAGDTSILFDRRVRSQPDGAIDKEYFELNPGEKSIRIIREISDKYGAGRGFDCKLPSNSRYRIFMPDLPGDTLEISIKSPAKEPDLKPFEICEVAVNLVETRLIPSNPSEVVPIRKKFKEQTGYFEEVLKNHSGSPYSLLAASKLVSYGYDSHVSIEVRKRAEMRLLGAAEQGYILYLMNIDLTIYDETERLYLRQRFLELQSIFENTHLVSDFIQRMIKNIGS